METYRTYYRTTRETVSRFSTFEAAQDYADGLNRWAELNDNPDRFDVEKEEER